MHTTSTLPFDEQIEDGTKPTGPITSNTKIYKQIENMTQEDFLYAKEKGLMFEPFSITKKELLKNKRSFCPKCNHLIYWYHNIPLFSYLFFCEQ